jgi:diketogulonate reductase-like aldo/keto reductase
LRASDNEQLQPRPRIMSIGLSQFEMNHLEKSQQSNYFRNI